MYLQWLQDNLIAVYGAIVGTIALFLNFGRFWLIYKKDLRRLKVVSGISESAQHQIDAYANPSDIFGKPKERDSNSLVGPIYQVTVLNNSHLSMHLYDVGLIVRTPRGKEKKQAYVRNHRFLEPLDKTGGDDLAPGSRKNYNVWIDSTLKLPIIIGCYAIDQLGKEYKGKHQSHGNTLSVPDCDDIPA